MVVSCDKATLAELQSVYGLEDLYDLIEIITVDARNARIMQERAEED